jgi:hypothetical protein
MARDVYYVVLHEHEWKISYNSKHYGPYDSQRRPIHAAVDAAHKAGAKNPDGAQVRVQGENNQFRTEWTYGNDPYPPKGQQRGPAWLNR